MRRSQEPRNFIRRWSPAARTGKQKNTMKTQLFERYAEIKTKIKEYEAAADIMSEQILEEMQDSGTKSLPLSCGVFTVASVKRYTYSDKVQTMEENVKIAKEKEKTKGIAKVVTEKSLRYAAKEKKES
jgi:hypothetical protein